MLFAFAARDQAPPPAHLARGWGCRAGTCPDEPLGKPPRKSHRAAGPGAHKRDPGRHGVRDAARPPYAAELTDLGGSDPGVEHGVNAGHASTSRAFAQEADDFDHLAYVGKLHPRVLVELVDRIRVLQGEPHGVIAPRLGHKSTMAGWR
jgi:hypothetical protein